MSNLLLDVEDDVFSLFPDFEMVEEEETYNAQMVILTMIVVKLNQVFHDQVCAELAQSLGGTWYT